MAIENITLNIIPTGDTPSIHVAQFDVDRPFTITLKEGADDFTPTGYDIELQVRKVDATIVTVLPTSTSGNVVTFNTTEQMTACSGTNLAEVQLTKDSQTFATLHFYLVVQRDVLAGGVTSESDIYNLTEQIAAIVPEVIGDDYYNKEEVDEKIAEIPTFDPTNYYDKSDVDTLLNGKADVSDLPDMSNYYNKTEVDNKITDLYQIKIVSGSIVHFTDGGNNIPVKLLVSEIVAVQSGSGTPSPSNPRPISGFDNGIITVTDNDQITNTYTFAFGQTVYGGHFDNKGNLVVTHGTVDLGDFNWLHFSSANKMIYGSFPQAKKPTSATQKANILCEIFETISRAEGGYAPPYTKTGIGIDTRGSLFIQAPNSTWTDVPSAVTEITGYKLVYELATPITLSITSQDIPTLLGENNISSNTGDIEAEYFTEKSDGIAELIKAFM